VKAAVNKNYVHEEIKRRLNPVNQFYHSVQNPSSSLLLHKGVKIKHAKLYNIKYYFVWMKNLIFHPK
jgi:hypothetical protein